MYIGQSGGGSAERRRGQYPDDARGDAIRFAASPANQGFTRRQRRQLIEVCEQRGSHFRGVAEGVHDRSERAVFLAFSQRVLARVLRRGRER